MVEKVLSQKEIDELFERYAEQPIKEEAADLLSINELDTIGEIGNICMGAAATTLFELLRKPVKIAYPQVIVCNQEEVFGSFLAPYLIIEFQFKEGLNGFNVLVIREEEVAVIADVMLGGTGELKDQIRISEMEMSATTEAMNQMIGASATAMSELFGVTIDISPPQSRMVRDLTIASHTPLATDKPVVVARFEIEIGDMLKTTLMQITNVDAAKEEANFLLMKAGMFGNIVDEQPITTKTLVPSIENLPNLERALAVQLDMLLTVGKVRCTVEDLAKMQVGDEIEFTGSANYVDLMVGDMPVARGELYEADEGNFIKVTKVYQSTLQVKRKE